MKNITLTLLSLLAFSGAFAQEVGNGYYRIQNYDTHRYLSLQDSTGSVDYNSGGLTADLYAIRTLEDNDRNHILSNPATVIYINEVSRGQYVCSAQGTDTRSITAYTFQIRNYNQNGKPVPGVKRIMAEKERLASVRLFEMVNKDSDGKLKADSGYIFASSDTKDSQFKWRILPVSSSSDNYLSIKPTIAHDGRYYGTFYIGFPFKVASSNLTVYYVSKLAKGKAVVKPFGRGDVIPAGTPVVAESSSAAPSDNRIELVTGSQKAPADNLLKGVYFRYNYEFGKMSHHNITPYESATMRLLRLTDDGQLAFVKASLPATGMERYIPANTAYLPVTEGTADVLPLQTYADYTAGISSVRAADAEQADHAVYTLSGVRVKSAASLPHGIYIVGGKKVVK